MYRTYFCALGNKNLPSLVPGTTIDRSFTVYEYIPLHRKLNIQFEFPGARNTHSMVKYGVTALNNPLLLYRFVYILLVPASQTTWFEPIFPCTSENASTLEISSVVRAASVYCLLTTTVTICPVWCSCTSSTSGTLASKKASVKNGSNVLVVAI